MIETVNSDTGEVELRLESQLAAKLIIMLMKNDAGKSKLALGLGHKTVSGELNKQIKRLLKFDYVKMTIPDKPSSSKQKYRLTAKGKALLEIENQ